MIKPPKFTTGDRVKIARTDIIGKIIAYREWEQNGMIYAEVTIEADSGRIHVAHDWELEAAD